MDTLSVHEIWRRAQAADRKATALNLHLLNWTCKAHTVEQHERIDAAIEQLERFITRCEQELDARGL